MGVRQISKIAVAWDMMCQGLPKTRIADNLAVHRRTIIRWHHGIVRAGSLESFIDSYIAAKKGERAKRIVNPILKRKIWKLREEHNDCCGQKIEYFLKKDHHTKVGTTTIYKVLSEKYQLRTRWKKNKVRGHVPKATKPREVVQMDSVDFGSMFAFTAIDIFSREADVLLRPSLTAQDGQLFLETSMQRRFNRFSDTIQTDGGSEFKAEFSDTIPQYCHRHRYARPYKKNEQSYIESFNRSLRKECLGWIKYKPADMIYLTQKVNKWLSYYHYIRPHIGIGMKPPLKSSV